MTEHWYKLDITCGVCEHEGKIVILGALLSKNPNQKEALAEFLSNLDAESCVTSIQKMLNGMRPT